MSPRATSSGGRCPCPAGDRYAWDDALDVRQVAAVLRGHDAASRGEPSDIHGARVLALLGDSVTTDHISPAGSIRRTARRDST